jgi:hypothetical protein
MNDLRRTVEAGRVMEVTHGVEEQELNPRHLRKSCLGFQLSEPSVPIGLGEHIRSLVDEVDALTADHDGPELLRDDDLKNESGLVRGAVEGRSAK